MVRKANCLLATFPRVGPFILTRLFQSYCLSLYGSGLWTLSCPALQNIEVAFNKMLRRIWSLPACSHTHIVHLVANLRSLFNVIYRRSNSLLHAAAHCPSALVQTIYCDSSLSYNGSPLRILPRGVWVQDYNNDWCHCKTKFRRVRPAIVLDCRWCNNYH